MLRAVQAVPHFYWSQCLVCHKEDNPSSTLQRCSRCHLAPYCSSTHQKSHWQQHKQLCNFFSESAVRGEFSFFSPLVGSSQKEWIKSRLSLVTTCSTLLGRPLSQLEKEMLLFPRACHLTTCYSVTGRPAMLDCKDCLCVSYCCQEHRKKDKKDHTKVCKQLLLARMMDRQEMLMGLKEASPAPHHDSQYMGTSRNIQCHMTKMVKVKLMAQFGWDGPMAMGDDPTDEGDPVDNLIDPDYMDTAINFAKLTDHLTGPLTLLDIGHKFIHNFGTKKKIMVHLVGASFCEMVDLMKWENLAHRLPDLKSLQFAFVGPEWDQGEGETGETVSNVSCPVCLCMGKSISYREFGGLYQEYKKSAGFTPPDILLVQNCGFAEYPDSEGKDAWVHGWAGGLEALLDTGVVLAFTSQTMKRAKDDLKRFLKYCGEEVEDLELLVKCKENGLRGRRPVRDHVGEEGDVIYNNEFISVLRKREVD